MGNDRISVEGQIDAGFTSYGVPSQKDEGETVAGTSDDDFGDVRSEAIPEEARGKGLDEKKLKVIETAALNPRSSLKDIGVKVDHHYTYVGEILRKSCPEWYENVFKNQGKSRKDGRQVDPVVSDDYDYDIEKPVSDEDILAYVEEQGGITGAELDEVCELNRSRCYERLSDLEDEGLLGRTRDGAKKPFVLADADTTPEQTTDESRTSPEPDRYTEDMLRAVCEFELDKQHSNRLAEFIIGTLNGDDWTPGEIKRVCEYHEYRNDETPIANAVEKIVGDSDG